MPTTIQYDFNPGHHCKGLPEEIKWFACRVSKHSLLPKEPSKWGGYPTSNYSSEDDDNKQQSFRGWESVSKAKQTCHSVKESNPTICPSSCTKDFPKATVMQTAAGTHKEVCCKISMPTETNLGETTPNSTFSYVFLYLSCSPVSPCLSTSPTYCHLKNQTNRKTVLFTSPMGLGNITTCFSFRLGKKRLPNIFQWKFHIFFKSSPRLKNAGNHHHNL